MTVLSGSGEVTLPGVVVRRDMVADAELVVYKRMRKSEIRSSAVTMAGPMVMRDGFAVFFFPLFFQQKDREAEALEEERRVQS